MELETKIKLTNDFIELGKSSNGGWNRDQVEILGLEWPLRAGWKERVIGEEFTAYTIRKFVGLKDAHIPRNEFS